jgi:hypothetical protein
MGSIRLYQLVRSHAAAAPAIHLATLHLPPTSDGNFVRGISCHAGPIEANPLQHASFTIQNDNDRLHVFKVVYDHYYARQNGVPTSLFYLFLHQRVLAKYAHRALTLEKPLDVLWEEWGPPNAMLTRPHTDYDPNFIRFLFSAPLHNDYLHISSSQIHSWTTLRFSRRYHRR